MRTVLILVLLGIASPNLSTACTAFCATSRGVTLAGNNEDYNLPRSKLWFVPSNGKTYGRLYVGFGNFFPQGGMNEKGLFFDGFATPRVPAKGTSGKPRLGTAFPDKIMAECATVEDVIKFLDQYDRSHLETAILMFADAKGDAIAVEVNSIVRKTGPFFVQTNFHQSTANMQDPPCRRFKIARAMLQQAGPDISVDLFRRTLAATHAEGTYPTLYSNIYDLNRRVMYLYHFHNFEEVVTIDLAAELRKGAHTFEIQRLFPSSHAAETFFEARDRASGRVKVAHQILADYAGSYKLPGGDVCSVDVTSDTLLVEIPGQFKLELAPLSETTFALIDTPLRFTFRRAPGGKVESVAIINPGEETIALRQP